jgi:hypothetical protein
MENVILDDSPLAEFLEGRRRGQCYYKAVEADQRTRRRQGAVPSVITHGIDFTNLAQLRTTRPLHAAVQDPR